MDCCLLCLEINKDIVDCISVTSKQWDELNIAKTIDKHFWSMNTVSADSWICLLCWKELITFHNFYLRIEEAHANFWKIKVENSSLTSDANDDFPIQKLIIKDSAKDIYTNDVPFGFLQPEILIDQSHQQETINLKDHPNAITYINRTEIAEPMVKLDLNTPAIEKTWKSLNFQSDKTNGDPLEKSNETKNKKELKTKVLVRKEKERSETNIDIKLKEELSDYSDDDSNSHVDNSIAEISCQPSKYSSQSVELKKSIRKKHDEFIAKNFKEMFCAICQLQLEDFQCMQKHFNDIHKQRGYVICCNRKYFDRTLLVEHIHCHLNPDHFECKECGKVMIDRKNLQSHMLRVHRPEDIVAKHSCDICGKSFYKAYVLRIHKLTHMPKEEKKFPCTQCGKFYASSYLLKLHTEVIHLRKQAKVCYICGKTLRNSTEYKTHMNKHEGAPVINCDVCGLRLISERSLKLHKESQHPVGGKQDHPCHLCEKISPTARALKKHISTMHEKGLDHKCTICEKSFRRPETLKEHMASHTGTPLYMCPWCPKTFNSNGNMHSHRKKMHPKEWEESKLQKYSSNILPQI